MKVSFSDNVDDHLLKFAVIMSEYQGKWVFCKHKDRDTYEIPGGHREKGESILETAKRELFEETGATLFDIRPVGAYSVKGIEETCGMLYYAKIEELSKLSYEIESIALFDHIPTDLTYPNIQPWLFYRTKKCVKGSSFSCVLWDWNGTLINDATLLLIQLTTCLQDAIWPLSIRVSIFRIVLFPLSVSMRKYSISIKFHSRS